MKVNILTTGRFHVLDLARELDKCGLDVKFYSFVPTKRAVKFGLPKSCSKSVIGIMFPLVYLVRKAKLKWLHTSLGSIQDYVVARYMRKCDIVIAMSGSFVYSLRVAKRSGATVILERGSKHILEQRKILEAIPSLQGAKPRPESTLRRELEGYSIADFISIASEHVRDSFVKHRYPLEKLFVNPYGVSLKHFYPTDKPQKAAYDIIMVGGWSYRKGCDLIIEAVRQLNASFLHVGGLVDLDFPPDDNFEHVDPVDEANLVEYYKKAKVFVLPSREEGLALVQAQAIACGLPLVCSKDSGGRDLRNFIEDKKWIIEMEQTTVSCLVQGIKEALKLAALQPEGKRDYSGNAIKENLTWEAYGRRYADFLNRTAKVAN